MKIKLTLFSLLISAATCPAATIANWKVMSAVSPLTVGGVPTSGLTTDSPVFGSTTTNAMDGIGVAGRFGTNASPQSVPFRWGKPSR